MAHTKRKRKFGRKSQQRKEFLRSLARSLILHEKIKTTQARAKALRPEIEKIITKARSSALATRKLLLSRFKNDEVVVEKLLTDLGPRYKNRAGGYTRIIKIETTPGTGRTVAIIEFV